MTVKRERGMCYRGWRSKGKTRVVIAEGGSISSLPHIVRHSPTGFEWGYCGSGPADLARSLLIHYKMTVHGSTKHQAADWAEGYYQEFKRHIVAVFPRERWTFDLVEITDWLEEQAEGGKAVCQSA